MFKLASSFRLRNKLKERIKAGKEPLLSQKAVTAVLANLKKEENIEH
jgi:hypothetical protein